MSRLTAIDGTPETEETGAQRSLLGGRRQAQAAAEPAVATSRLNLPARLAAAIAWLRGIDWVMWKRAAREAASAPGAKRDWWLLVFVVCCQAALGVLSPALYRVIIDRALRPRDASMLNLCAGALVIVYVARAIAGYFHALLAARVTSRVTLQFKARAFERLQRVSIRFFHCTDFPEVSRRLQIDTSRGGTLFGQTLISAIDNIVRSLGTVAIMLYLQWQTVVVVALLLGALYVPRFRLRAALLEKFRTGNVVAARLQSTTMETLQVDGALLTRLCDGADWNISRFKDNAAAVEANSLTVGELTGRITMLSTILSSFGVTTAYFVGGHLAIAGHVSVGSVVQFSVMVLHLQPYLSKLGRLYTQLDRDRMSLERLFEVLDLPQELQTGDSGTEGTVLERPSRVLDTTPGNGDPVTGAAGGSSVPLRRRRATPLDSGCRLPSYSAIPAFELRGVSFGYHSAEWDRALTLQSTTSKRGDPPRASRWEAKPGGQVLSEINISVMRGECVALCGVSGSGKSTIVRLLCRLYDPQAGQVLLDGDDVRSLPVSRVRSTVGVVSQDPYLFKGTLRDNLLFGLPQLQSQDRLTGVVDAAVPDEELLSACSSAGLRELVQRLPKGLDSPVGGRGKLLSTGERQRLCIARCLLRRTPIVVCDEPTASLDAISAEHVLSALRRSDEDRTCLVISHRESTVVAMDRVIVIDDGKVVADGAPADLDCDHAFARLFSRVPADSAVSR